MGPPRTAVGDQVGAVTQNTLLSAADCDFFRELQDSLSAEAADGRDYGGLVTAILGHLKLGPLSEHTHVQGAEGGLDQHDNIWGPIVAEAHTLPEGGGWEVAVTGPGPEDRFHVPASSQDDASHTVAFIAGVDAACRIITDMHNHCVLVIQKHQELEAGRTRLRQPAESTVNEHIRLLRQYNKVKDVGQQLIGLNADNRQVPVGPLYADEQYGVGPND